MRSFIVLLLISNMLLAQSPEFNMEIYAEENDSTVRILGNNGEFFPISVSLEVDLQGTRLREKLPNFSVLQPKTKATLLAVIFKPVNQSWSYRFSYSYSMGNALAVHNDDYAYQLPFPKGVSYRLTQGYNGKTTHRGLNALDFTMPEGDKITAARGGTVIRIKEDSNRGCPSANCANDGNFVTILHDDGTMADYVHLKQNGVLVELGDQVQAGQEIAINGATGWASGAHLHFVVYTTGKNAQETIKVKFESAPGNIESLKEGELYTAFK